MQAKKQIIVFIVIIVFLLISANIIFQGCAGTSSKKPALTPEREKAIRDSLYNVHKRKVALLYSFGFEPYKQGDFKKAKKYFIQVAEIDTSDIYSNVLYRNLGRIFLQHNIPDSAEWAYKTDLEKNPNSIYSYKALGYLYRVQGRTEKAIEAYQILAENEPDSTGHFRHLSELYILNEEPDKAIEALNVVIKLEPDDKKSQERLDNLLAQTGDIDAIIAQRESMIQRFPDDMEKRLELAQSYHRIGEFEKTIEQLKIVISKEPENIIALELLGGAYQNLEMFNNAISTFQMLIKINSNDKKNRCNMAMNYISLGKYTLAKRQVARAISVDRQYGLAFLTNGLIYETAADKCVANRSGQKITFDDKLVYKMAYDEYIKAKRDLEWKSDAEKHMKYLENMIPTNSDYFMHKNQDKPRSDCYNWIK